MRGAIVLAGGPSKRFGSPKALARIGDVPLVVRVVQIAAKVADEVVVVGRGGLATQLEPLVAPMPVVRDRARVRAPLVGLLTGAFALRAPYVAALPCDLPFINPRLLARLFARAREHDAAIPRWPDGRIEPLVAVYRRGALLAAARAALAAEERANTDMIRRLRRVRWVSVDSLRSVDPELGSFLNVNTPADLMRAERLQETLTERPAARPRTH